MQSLRRPAEHTFESRALQTPPGGPRASQALEVGRTTRLRASPTEWRNHPAKGPLRKLVAFLLDGFGGLINQVQAALTESDRERHGEHVDHAELCDTGSEHLAAER